MALTSAQATAAAESLADVFTPEGDAGVVERVRTFITLEGTVTKAQVFGRLVHGQWYPISDLDSAETLRGQA